MISYLNEFLVTMPGITLSMSAFVAVLLLLRKHMKKRFTADCLFTSGRLL